MIPFHFAISRRLVGICTTGAHAYGFVNPALALNTKQVPNGTNRPFMKIFLKTDSIWCSSFFAYFTILIQITGENDCLLQHIRSEQKHLHSLKTLQNQELRDLSEQLDRCEMEKSVWKEKFSSIREHYDRLLSEAKIMSDGIIKKFKSFDLWSKSTFVSKMVLQINLCK